MAPVEALHRFNTAEYDRLVASGALEDVRVELLDRFLVDVPAGVVEVHEDPRAGAFGRVRVARGDDALDAGVEGIALLRVGELLAGIQVS